MKGLIVLLALLLSVGVLACEELVEEPEPTPEITAHPIPTPIAGEETPTPSLPALSAAECEYLDAIGQQSRQLGNAVDGMVSLLKQPDVFSETWKIDMVIHLVNIDLISDDARALKPPSSLIPLHDQWLVATGLYTEMVDRLVKGIDELDVTEIEAATELMLQGVEAVRVATALINDFNASRSGVCP